jgi:LPS-assembly protein
MTSCSEDRIPDWSFRLGKARVNIDGFARVKNTRMRVKKLPVLYLPYMLFPVKSGRVPGLLFPNLGYSSSRGAVLGLAYFQPFGDSYDTTIYGDLYGNDYYGLGTEFRYRPSQVTGGTFRAFAIDDPIEDEVRWKASWRHSSNQLPFGLRGVVNYTDFSDFEFFRQFERNFNDVTIRSLYSSGFVSGNWGSHSLNIMADERETFIRTDVTVTQRQLPEIEYRLRPTRLGRLPLYLSLLTSASQLEIDRTDVIAGSYSRADFLPTLTLPLSTVPWLSFSVAASGRTTWYGDSLTENGQDFRGESLTRTAPSVSASLIGPSFSKVADKRIGSFGKFKHVIEPRWSYLRIDEFDDQELVPLFDEVDTLVAREIFSVSLVNRLLAKPADEDSLAGAREILSFELGQSFSLNDQPFERSRDLSRTGTKSPISARLRFTPSDRASLEARTTYSALFDRMSSASLLGGLRFGPDSVGLTWVTSIDPEQGSTRSHQARVFTSLTLIKNHLRMENQINLDLLTGLVQQHRHIFYYTSQCYGLRFEFREFKTTTRRDRDIRFAVSLKNIGTFLDLNHGEQNRFP